MSTSTIQKKFVVDENGEPVEVVIPYAQFMEWVETYGLDFSEQERAELKAAIADSQSGNREAFESLESVE
ncbi:MAG: hypothetical protein CMO74_08485 [Verrucomicrobiales bacterium]|nr:hypothetical protein [Verrucomicrobiales bacterium]|tara:strand:- start:2369 stop:2578 length:210 start_codon:yes stop_codon:yes gene_type:complete